MPNATKKMMTVIPEAFVFGACYAFGIMAAWSLVNPRIRKAMKVRLANILNAAMEPVDGG